MLILMSLKLNKQKMPGILLRVGLGLVFLYAGIDSLREPLVWVGYVPGFLVHVLKPDLSVRIIAVYELVLAAWLLSGKFKKYAALLSCLTLAGIVALNTKQLIITFRDVGLLFASLALFFLED